MDIIQPTVNKSNIRVITSFVTEAKQWAPDPNEIQVSYEAVNLYPSVPIKKATDVIIQINNVCVDSHVKFMTRIGEKLSNKNRPIKVVLGSAHERYLLMKNLANLKGKSKYKGISVTKDFTVFERGLIKEWANKAKERTKEENDSGFVWRVRRSPFKGLYLKKIKRNNSIEC